jgi:glycosyltransferase involved in cell wall biosynthesis
LRVVSFGSEQAPGLEFLRNRLTFTAKPSQEDIRQSYTCCDVWLMTSTSEGFGLPALEAMACRTPLVSTRMGWPQSAVVDGVNGWLAPVGDIEALASRVARVLSMHEADWQRLSAAAFETAAGLSWENSLSQFVQVLERARQSPLRIAA